MNIHAYSGEVCAVCMCDNRRDGVTEVAQKSRARASGCMQLACSSPAGTARHGFMCQCKGTTLRGRVRRS